MGKVTAQQFWHDQRFMSMIYIRYLQRKYHSDVYPIFQSWTYRLVSQLGDNQLGGWPTVDPHKVNLVWVNWATMPQLFLRVLYICLFWLICSEALFCCAVTDVDECSTNNGNCNSQAKCTNTPGSFTCTCLEGYTGDGISCSGNEWTIVLYFCKF